MEFIMNELLAKEEGYNKAARLAVKLDITESYVRMIATGKNLPGQRLARDIQILYDSTKDTTISD